MTTKSFRAARRISLIYGAVAVVWILFSDRLVAHFLPTSAQITAFQTFKGISFVVATTGLLFLSMREHLRRRDAEEARRREAEEARRAADESLRRAVKAANVGLWERDLRSNAVRFSPEWKNQIGYAADEIPDSVEEWRRRVHPDDLAEAERTMADCAANPQGRELELEFRLRHKDGRWRWILAHGSVERDGAGGAVRLLGFNIDITERKQAETLVAGQRQILEMIATGAPLPATLEVLVGLVEAQTPDMLASVVLLDADGVRMHVGAAPHLPAAFNAGLEGVAIGPAAGSCGTALFRGEPVIVEDIAADPLWESCREQALPHGLRACWSTPIFDPRRQVLGSFAMYFREPRGPSAQDRHTIDLAAHIAAIAITRSREEEALRASEERFRELAETIQEVFWILDPNLPRVLYVSPAFATIWGRPRDHAYARWENWLDSIHPDDRARVAQAVAARRPQAGSSFEETYRIRRPDGVERWIRDRAFPVLDEGGNVIRYVGVATDITDSRRLEEQFFQSQKMEAVGQLAGGVAHDFNNVLAVIRIQAELLQGDPGLAPGVAEAVAEIMQAVERAASLTRQLLVFSRRQTMQMREVDLNSVVAGITKLAQRLLPEHLTTELAYAPAPLPVQADAGMLDQVLMNLAVNARDAMPDGGVIRVETAAVDVDGRQAALQPGARPGRFARLSVSDTGCGIPPEILPRIFEPFFTTKAIGHGTGLGLPTVFGIVEQHHGWIDVQTAIGRGTTFHVYLPLQAAAAGLPVAADDPLEEAPPGSETVLVVEDERSLRRLVRDVLKRLGYTVLEAASGAEALDLWVAHRDEIDLLLTDLVMPDGMSGTALARQLQAEDPGLRVVYTSGYSPEFAGGEVVLNPGVNFLAKPYSVLELGRIVRARLDG